MKRWREQLQGLGIATLFVPVSQLAYSNLPKHKNNKASNLTNLFRNQGGSFGIAFVTTLLARRTQYHESVLVAHATPLDERYRQLLASLTNYFGTHGFSHSDAAVRVQAQAFRFAGAAGDVFGISGLFYGPGMVRSDGCATGVSYPEIQNDWGDLKTTDRNGNTGGKCRSVHRDFQRFIQGLRYCWTTVDLLEDFDVRNESRK